ncbi:hypothetical protein [Endozoicomonas sp. 2B-B]
MTSIAVRKSGGASIVSIPKAVLKTLGIRVEKSPESIIDQSDKIAKLIIS